MEQADGEGGEVLSSPIAQPALHDTFVLLIGSKRIVLPGTARVTVGLAANLDTQDTPGGGNTQAQINEPTGEISVQLTMTEHTEWLKYRDVLAIFRRGTEKPAVQTEADKKAGTLPPINRMSVFTCAHPEVTSRRIKRLYFVSEQSQPYSPRSGYIVSLVFREQLKAKTGVIPADTGDYTFPGQGGGTGGTGATSTSTAYPTGTPAGQRLALTALAMAGGKPIPIANSGGKNTAYGGYCSAFVREAWMATHNNDRSLFGEAAGGKAYTDTTEGRFKAAGYTQPYVKGMEIPAGTVVFYGNDKSQAGHVGIADGKGNVIGNNMLTYLKARGQLDAAGRPTGFDDKGKFVDARGVWPTESLGIPTSIASPDVGSMPQKLLKKPATPQSAPRSASAPSNNVPAPPGAFKTAQPTALAGPQFPLVRR